MATEELEQSLNQNKEKKIIIIKNVTNPLKSNNFPNQNQEQSFRENRTITDNMPRGKHPNQSLFRAVLKNPNDTSTIAETFQVKEKTISQYRWQIRRYFNTGCAYFTQKLIPLVNEYREHWEALGLVPFPKELKSNISDTNNETQTITKQHKSNKKTKKAKSNTVNQTQKTLKVKHTATQVQLANLINQIGVKQAIQTLKEYLGAAEISIRY